MICIIHGYLLDGSGSNLWTRSIVQSLVRQGETIHLVCQENHPEDFDFISEAWLYRPGAAAELLFRREVAYPGRSIMHKPELGHTLPVYVWDHYEEFKNVVPMVELPTEALEDYLKRNTDALVQVVRNNDIRAMHVNHAVLMSVAAERVSRETGVPFAIMPHGSAIEYAVKKDERFLRYAVGAFTAASRVFVIGGEMRERVTKVLGEVPGIESKLTEMNLAADTTLFEPVEPGERAKNIERLKETVAGSARGKSAKQTESLIDKLSDDLQLDTLKEIISKNSDYTNKQPDHDLEEKLSAVRWSETKTLLFVGRIIASKGIQSVIAALPLILGAQPGARLLVIGHGPLREPLEALLWALEHGARNLVENIVTWGRELEGTGAGPLEEVRLFFEQMEERGELDGYFEKAARTIRRDRVIFTGYLTHRELRYIFPCSDVAVFPSVVAEAGPLVFLEALASGCFPLGTYFAGMAASIDSVAEELPAEDADLMRVSPDPARTVSDIARKATAALALAGKHKATLREVAVRRYDWQSVARRLKAELNSLV